MGERIERLAATDLPVLFLGETGVGKEYWAAELHRFSARASGPFVRMHAGAIAPTLFESEIFGHVRGAFSGADRSKRGLFEEAEGGTILVDEVGDLPLEAQSKLLRVLEDRRIRPVGATQDRFVDVRIVAATNRPLEEDVAAGRFRMDLYFRIAGATVVVPPLRERAAEIPVLVEACAAEWAREQGVPPPSFDGAAMHALAAYDWPGNVRELRLVVRRALFEADGSVVGVHCLPREEMAMRSRVFGASEPPPSRESAPEHEEERARIERVLAEVGGNQTRAAERLGISRRTLIHRLELHGVARPRKASRPPV